MAQTTDSAPILSANNARPRERALVLLAFAAVYFVWGSTYLAIRIAVAVMPPFMVAAMRFTSAGAILFAWQAASGQPLPTRTEWSRGAVLGAMMFLIPYSALFWSERHIASGMAAVILATTPLFTLALEVWPFQIRRLRVRMAAGMALGFVGVIVLTFSLPAPGQHFNRTAAIVLTAAAISWSLGSLLTRNLGLPRSKAMSASVQMLTGGAFLFVLSFASGEHRSANLAHVPASAWLSLAYLVLFGSVVSFTAYVWLLGRKPPSIVSTYAFVNPVVAVVLGWLFAGERLSWVQCAASAIIVGATALVLMPERSPSGRRLASSAKLEPRPANDSQQ